MRRKQVYIIAEAGINHNGDFETAAKMVQAAAACGANAIKFQAFITEKLFNIKKTPADLVEKFKRWELSKKELEELKQIADKEGIDFLATPFDEESLEFLVSLGVPAIKIASGDLDNFFLLKKAASSGLPIYLSTGAANLWEVARAFFELKKWGAKNVILMHCVSSYPADFEELNLKVIQTYANAFKCEVGFSDHTQGILAPLLAVALGATVIEKHFTLDRNLPGPDQILSLEPEEMAQLVQAIRDTEKALGDGVKRIMPSEEASRLMGKRALYFSKDMKAGETITEENIIALRPAEGLSPMLAEVLLGKKISKNVNKNDPISLEVLE